MSFIKVTRISIALLMLLSFACCDVQDSSAVKSNIQESRAVYDVSEPQSGLTAELKAEIDSICEKYGAMGAQIAVIDDGSYQAQPLFYAQQLYGRSGIYFHTGSAYGVYSCFSYDGEVGDGVAVITTGAEGTQGQYDIYGICDEINALIYEYTA